jgi:MFS family permease
LKEAAYGFQYIFQRSSLLGLQLVFMVGNFFASLAFTLLAPMILARTGNNALIFGSVETAGAIGGVLGGVAMSAWGGPKRRVHGVLSGWTLSGLFGTALIGLGRSLPVWATGNFISAFLVPLINSSNQAIWQAKVAPDVQGRVFATRRLIAWFVTPIATLLAGPLADNVFGPAMSGDTFLSASFGWLVGTGNGAGMSLIILLCGLAMSLVGLGGYAFREVRQAEIILPDHDVIVESTVEDRTRLQELLETRQHWITQPASPERERALKEIRGELREIGRRNSTVV